MSKALLVIDMQNDYLWDKRKPMFSYDRDALTGSVNQAIAFYKGKGYDIIYIKHVLSKLMWGVGFSIRGTEGAELYSAAKLSDTPRGKEPVQNDRVENGDLPWGLILL